MEGREGRRGGERGKVGPGAIVARFRLHRGRKLAGSGINSGRDAF